VPTTLFLRNIASSLGGAGQFSMGQRRGRVVSTAVTTSTASGTNIQITATAGGTALTFFSEPLTEGVTISGTVTPNLRGLESANGVNAGFALLVERANTAGVAQSTVIARQVIGAELATTEAARTASLTPTSTAFAAGERIRVTISLINVGTMGAGTVTMHYNGAASAASGDNFLTFTENFCTDDIQDVSPFEIVGRNAYYG
jgi:predicted acyl esterase